MKDAKIKVRITEAPSSPESEDRLVRALRLLYRIGKRVLRDEESGNAKPENGTDRGGHQPR
jgi:hypothetical protein